MDVNIRGCHNRQKNCPQFRLLTWTSFIAQFIHPVGGKVGVKGMDWGYRYFSQLRVLLYLVHANLM